MLGHTLHSLLQDWQRDAHSQPGCAEQSAYAIVGIVSQRVEIQTMTHNLHSIFQYLRTVFHASQQQ